MTSQATTPTPICQHPGPALGCAICPASTRLARQQPDQGAAAGPLALWFVPGIRGDVKDNPKPVLVWGLGMKDLNMSPCTAAGVPGEDTCWFQDQLDALWLLALILLGARRLLSFAVLWDSLGLTMENIAAVKPASTASASPSATQKSGNRPG